MRVVRIGDVICGYEVIESLGSGGISQIYKAKAPDGHFVTLKVPLASLIGEPATYERFLREFRIGKELSHPAIQRATALGQSQEGPCLILEYIEGKSIRAFLNEQAPLPLDDTLLIGQRLAEALIYLHNHGVFHRDLKPENVLIEPNGKAHILDFGIALLKGARRVTWRNVSDVLGTPDYMSPEQVQGKRGDERTDIYALGIMMYEMLTGVVPFRGDNALAVMNQHLTSSPRPPRELNPGIPENLEAVILKSIRKNPNERYQSAAALLDDLKNYPKLDISKFPRGEEAKVRGVVTNRQMWLLGGIIAFGFLAIIALVITIVFLVGHR